MCVGLVLFDLMQFECKAVVFTGNNFFQFGIGSQAYIDGGGDSLGIQSIVYGTDQVFVYSFV